MRTVAIVALAATVLTSGNLSAASTSEITADVTFTLTAISIGSAPASEFDDYEADGGVEFSGFGSERFELGGSGVTSGMSAATIRGQAADFADDADPLEVGDSFGLAVDASATADTGFVSRDQNAFAGFSFFNFTDDGLGGYQTLSFVFDFTVSYLTTLTNDRAGDQALAGLNVLIALEDDGVFDTDYDDDGDLDLYVINSPGGDNAYEALSFAAGTQSRSGSDSGQFVLQLDGSYGYFTFDATATTPTFVQPVPVPAALGLLGCALAGLVAGAGRRPAVSG